MTEKQRTEGTAEPKPKPTPRADKPAPKTGKPAAQESRLGLVPPARAATATARPRTAGSTLRPAKSRFRLTRRATILVLALCAVVVTIAYPLQEYLAQRSQLNSINEQNAELSKQDDKLQQQISLWRDPGYVAIQARSLLHYVLPGEEGFTLPGSTIGGEQLGMPAPTVSPWYDTLWGTVKSPSAAPSTGSGGR
jgi:cell division protein FtsB